MEKKISRKGGQLLIYAIYLWDREMLLPHNIEYFTPSKS